MTVINDVRPDLAAWAQRLRGEGMSENTVSAYVSDVERYGGMPEVGIGAWIDRSAAIRRSGLAPRTIARHLAAHARLARDLGVSDVPFCRRPSVGVVLPTVVPTTDEMVRFINAEPDLMYRALWSVMCGGGLRLSEALGLRWVDVIADRMRVLGKGSKVRDVPLSEPVRAALQAIHPGTFTMTQLIFPVSSRTVQRMVKINAVRAGLPETWHPHALRHGFGTAVQEAGKDLRLTADLMGHVSVATTMIYTHTSSTRRAAAVANVLDLPVTTEG